MSRVVSITRNRMIRNLWLPLLVCVYTGPVWAQPVATSQPTTSASAASTSLSAEALRKEGINAAMAGNFKQGLAQLKQAQALQPDDAVTTSAIQAIQTYLSRAEAIAAKRQSEYDYELKRIRWANLAQKFQDDVKEKPWMKELRKKIKTDLIDAYQAMGTSEGFDEASAEEAAEMKSTTLKSIETLRKTLAEAESLLKGETSEYATQFRSEAEILRTRLNEFQAVWEKADPAKQRSRWADAKKIDPVEEQLGDALSDLEVLVTKNPWKIAMLHGRIAKTIAPDPQKVANQLWFIDLLKEGETRGKQAIAKARWYDALTAYVSLEDLDPDSENYRSELDKVRRHVRVLRLYGKDDVTEEDEAEVPQDEATAEIPEEPVWKEMIEGVDAQMARRAIKKLGESYVKSVDYRKLTRGALESILVLANTPQVVETFPGLKDEKKKAEFIKALQSELDDIKKKDHVDDVRLQMALNKVMYSSEETVGIPIAVLVVEFADGMLNELDKFSNMIWPYDVTNFNKSTMGQFTGIGVQIIKEPNKPLKVVTPLLGAPALTAGIKAGDLILKVDGEPTEKQSVDKLIKKIMGPPGSTVKLTIKRRGVAEPFDVPVIRRAVHIRTVKGWRRQEDGTWTYQLDTNKKIGYIRLTQFTDTTHEHLNEALKAMKQDGVTSLILDLRSNPGGLLRSATAIANEFIDSGRIVYTRGRQVPRNEISADRDGTYLNGDLVVLIDKHSASAAEILSGALKDWHRGLIVGERSYGKGSVQNVIPIRNQEAFLKLTTAYYYLPSGRLLHRQNGAKDWGVNPDVDISISPRQMRRWLNIRRKTDLLQKFSPELLKTDLEQQYDADIQLNTAVLMLELMKLKRQAGSTTWFAADAKTDNPS